MVFLESLKSKIVKDTDLPILLKKWQAEHKKLVFTNGCFDLIHRGHVEYLAQAAALGDVLVIGLNTDSSVSRIKGKDRPVQDEYARAVVLAAFSFVDAVVFFDEDTPEKLIQAVQPDVLIKGSDYKPEQIVGYQTVTAKGGQVKTINFTAGYSSSRIIEKIIRAYNPK